MSEEKVFNPINHGEFNPYFGKFHTIEDLINFFIQLNADEIKIRVANYDPIVILCKKNDGAYHVEEMACHLKDMIQRPAVSIYADGALTIVDIHLDHVFDIYNPFFEQLYNFLYEGEK